MCVDANIADAVVVVSFKLKAFAQFKGARGAAIINMDLRSLFQKEETSGVTVTRRDATCEPAQTLQCPVDTHPKRGDQRSRVPVMKHCKETSTTRKHLGKTQPPAPFDPSTLQNFTTLASLQMGLAPSVDSCPSDNESGDSAPMLEDQDPSVLMHDADLNDCGDCDVHSCASGKSYTSCSSVKRPVTNVRRKLASRASEKRACAAMVPLVYEAY